MHQSEYSPICIFKKGHNRQMTPEQEARILELPYLITDEKAPEMVKVLASYHCQSLQLTLQKLMRAIVNSSVGWLSSSCTAVNAC